MQIELAGNRGANIAQLSVLTNLDSKRLDKVLQALSGKGKIFCFDREEKGYFSAGASAELAKRCLAVAEAFHKKEPLKQGMARGALLSGGTGREAWSKGLAHRFPQVGSGRAARRAAQGARGRRIHAAEPQGCP